MPETGTEDLLYAEDLPEGRVFELASHTVTAEEIKDFARAWDPLPMHVDEEWAKSGPFGEVIASGGHTLAICIRLASDAVVSRTAIVAGRGIDDVRFFRPVRPGMELTGKTTIADRRMLDDGRAAVVLDSELRDQSGETIMRLVGETIVRRRNGG